MIHVSSVGELDRNAVSGELSGATLSSSVSKECLSYSRSHASSYNYHV